MKKLRSSQASISINSCTGLSKVQFFRLSIVKSCLNKRVFPAEWTESKCSVSKKENI